MFERIGYSYSKTCIRINEEDKEASNGKTRTTNNEKWEKVKQEQQKQKRIG